MIGKLGIQREKIQYLLRLQRPLLKVIGKVGRVKISHLENLKKVRRRELIDKGIKKEIKTEKGKY
jgi:hypothetical protein